MRHPFRIGASVLVVGALAFAPSAPAQCAEGLEAGTSMAFEIASTDGTIGGKGMLKVEKNDGSYLEVTVAADKGKVLMPGGIDGNRDPDEPAERKRLGRHLHVVRPRRDLDARREGHEARGPEGPLASSRSDAPARPGLSGPG